MEMKRKQKHISLRCSNQGFTMIELLVALVVSLLAMAAIYSTFLAQHRSYQVQKETSEMQQNIRAAMFYMQREIRMAGSNPFNELPFSSFGIQIGSNANSITFTEDVNGGALGTPPDGAITAAAAASENITYNLDVNRNLVRTVGGVGQVVAQNIDWLDFVYLKDDGTVAATLADIRSVEITIVARTDDPLLYGTTNNNVYMNQQGTASFVAPNDNFSRRRLTTLIHCRNLAL